MPKLTVATMTWAHTPKEADLLASSMAALAEHGFPIVLADGGSIGGFTDRLRALHDVTTVMPRLGPGRLVGQIESAMAGAARPKPEYVLYTEPDKEWFFRHRLADFVAALERQAGVGVLLASRDEASFGTFPAGQRLTEGLFNQLAAQTIGAAGDTLYGPMFVRADLVPHVTELHEDMGWGWRPYLMAIAHRLGAGVAYHLADLPCPEHQRGEDHEAARIYRVEQLAQNVKGLALGMKADIIHEKFHI